MNLHGRSLIPCLLEIFAKTLFILFIFIVCFFLHLSFLHCLFSFAIFDNMPLLVIFKTHPCFLLLLFCSAFFCHVAILVAVKALGLSIFEIIIGLSNIHWLSLSSISYSSASLVIMSPFYGFISLSY